MKKVDELLMKAVRKENNIETIEQFIQEQKASPDAICDQSSKSLLHEAAYYGQVKNIQWLIEKYDLDLNERNDYGDTALHFAAKQGQIETMEYLISLSEKQENDKEERIVCKHNNGYMTAFDYLEENYGSTYDQILIWRKEMSFVLLTHLESLKELVYICSQYSIN